MRFANDVLDGLHSGVTVGGIHLSFGLLMALMILVAALVLFVATKLAGRIIVSVATAVILGWLGKGGYIDVW